MMHTFYILGAGASAGIVPTTRELKEKIVTRYQGFGIYPVEEMKPDSVFERVIGDSEEATDELLRHFFPSAVHAMVLQHLAPSPRSSWFDQYGLFLLAARPSTFFDMNVDGLAKRFCIGHYVLEPHGRIPSAIVHTQRWNQLIHALLEYGFEAPRIPGVLLPQPEPIDITSRPAYSAARKLFSYGQYLVIIGYSFGKSAQDAAIDDLETFEFFKELLKRFRKTVLVLGPEPALVGHLCREAMGRDSVHLIPVYWNHLSAAISSVVHGSKQTDLSCLSSMTSKVLYEYDQFCDKGAT